MFLIVDKKNLLKLMIEILVTFFAIKLRIIRSEIEGLFLLIKITNSIYHKINYLYIYFNYFPKWLYFSFDIWANFSLLFIRIFLKSSKNILAYFIFNCIKFLDFASIDIWFLVYITINVNCLNENILFLLSFFNTFKILFISNLKNL